jgi:DNA repair exonuclease SbcCD nuclease subunit
MKLVLVSDIHLLSKRPSGRIDSILSSQWDKLRFIFETANSLDGIIIQAGDLFDKPRDWEILSKFISLKNEFPNVKLFSVYGQHDMYYRTTDSVCNMSLLQKLGMVEILSQTPYYLQEHSLYGSSFGEYVPAPNRSKPILVIHAPISESYVNTEYKPAAEFLRRNKFDVILCGDIHIPFIVHYKERMILNTGCIVRHVRDEVNKTYQPFFYILDSETKTLETKFIPALPFDEAFAQSSKTQIESLNHFIEELIDKQTKSVDIMDSLSRIISELKDDDPIKEIFYKLCSGKEVS